MTLAAVDALLHILAPVDHHLLQTEDGVIELARSNPSTIVLGSSYARSFIPLRRELERRTGRKGELAVIPDEGGQFIPYRDVLEGRIRPLLEERNAAGGLVRDSVRRFIFVTSHYDLCPLWAGAPNAKPAHAWHIGDFLRDAQANGITDFNRNYLRARWNRLWPWSALVQDRGVGRIQGKLRSLLPGESERQAALIENYKAAQEAQAAECQDPAQKRAVEDMLQYLTGRGIAVTMVLFPQDPIIVTPRSRSTTLKQYADYVADLASRYPVQVVDLGLDHPLGPDAFMADLDHLNPKGERQFSIWALDGPLAFLLQPPSQAGTQP